VFRYLQVTKFNKDLTIMGTIRTIAKNSLFYFIGQVGSCILSFFFFMQAARYLGAGDFGILSFALALAAIFGAFSDLGLRQIATREVARDKSLAAKYLANVAGIKIILVVIVSAGLVILVNILNYPQKTRYVVYLIGLSIVFNAFIQMFYAIFQANEKMEFESVGNILRNSLLLVSALLVITTHSSVLALALLYPAVDLLILVYAAGIYLWKFGKLRIEVDISFLKPTLKHALPFGLTTIFGMIYHWIGTVMLSTMKGDVVVGWYSAAYRIVFVLLLMPVAFDMAVFPVMSRLYVSSHDSLKLMCEKGFKYMTFISIPIGIGGTLLADRIILLVFGSEYSNSVIALKILIWSAVLIFMGVPFSTVLNSTNRQLVLAKVVGVSVILNVFLNLVLIPKYGLFGASISSVVSIFLLSVLVIGVVGYRLGYRVSLLEILKSILKAVISGVIMGLFILCFNRVNLFLLLVLSVSFYFLSLYFIGGFDRLDLAVVKGLTARR
jgi:O-antigen/teichoic acid export membrane protein